MIFLVEYNRAKGQIIKLEAFDDQDREIAEKTRLQLELNLNRLGKEHEVVLLEAANEKALRRSHGRYFESLTELVKAS